MKLPSFLYLFLLIFMMGAIMGCNRGVDVAKDSSEISFFVGTYTKNGSKGIYHCKLDTMNGKIVSVGLAAAINQPSYLTISLDDNYLWAVQEGVGATDSVVAYEIKPNTHQLTEINKVAVKGSGACYVSATNENNYLGVACYGSGSLSLIPLYPSGRIDTSLFVVRFSGKGFNNKRQEAPHCHSVVQDPNGYLYSTDLGTDKISIYKILADSLLFIDRIYVTPGSGPRHLAFDPLGKYMALVNELNSSVELYVKGNKNYFNKRQFFRMTVPASYLGKNSAADIHFSPNGRFLYVSNRGHESIACYEVLRSQESLRLIEYMRDQVKQPRNFSFDPSGRFLLVANQSKNTISSYRIERDSGIPIYTGSFVAVQTPVCIKFLNQDAL